MSAPLTLLVLGPHHGTVCDTGERPGYTMSHPSGYILSHECLRKLDRVAYRGIGVRVRTPPNATFEAVLLGLLSLPDVEITWAKPCDS